MSNSCELYSYLSKSINKINGINLNNLWLHDHKEME